jgi:ATP-dependent Clp protease ATP-binding subunit ClpA
MSLSNQRKTERVQRLLAMIEDTARKSGHNFIYPGHILLALLDLGDGVAWEILKNLNINHAAIRSRLLKNMPPGSGSNSNAAMQISEEAQNVFEATKTASNELGDIYIGTEHILLGLLAPKIDLPTIVLRDSGLTWEKAWGAVIQIFAKGTSPHIPLREKTLSSGEFLDRLFYSIQRGANRAIISCWVDTTQVRKDGWQETILLLRANSNPERVYSELHGLFPGLDSMPIKLKLPGSKAIYREAGVWKTVESGAERLEH